MQALCAVPDLLSLFGTLGFTPMRWKAPSRKQGSRLSSVTKLVPLTVWGALGVMALMLDSGVPEVGHSRAQGMTALLTILFGTWVFWSHGGNQVTAAGIYSLSMAMFVGFSGIWWLLQSEQLSDGVYLATVTGFWSTFAMFAIFWQQAPTFKPIKVESIEPTRWGMWFGLFLSAICVAGLLFAGPVLAQVSLLALTLLTASLVLHRFGGQRIWRRLLVGGAVTVVFAETVFTGFGRLMLVSLGLVAVLLVSAWGMNRRVKSVVLAAVGPALVFLIRLREEAQSELGHPTDGIGSVVSPLTTFGELIERGLSHAEGEPFLGSLLFWVPRELWEGKPAGFGTVLTAELEPKLLATGHSMAAQSTGEWFFSWGWLGVVALVVVLGLYIRWLDRKLAKVTRQPIRSRFDLLKALIIVVLVVELPGLAWGSSFTYFTRAGQKVAVLLALIALFALARPTAERRPPATPGEPRRKWPQPFSEQARGSQSRP